jgi:hypothetical protein
MAATLARTLKASALSAGQRSTRPRNAPGLGNEAWTGGRFAGDAILRPGRGLLASAPAPVAGDPDSPLDTQTDAPLRKTAVGNGTGTSVPALGLLGLLALIAPQLCWRLRSRHELAVVPPVVLLLDHPG